MFYRESHLQAQWCVGVLHAQRKRTAVCVPEGSVGFFGGLISNYTAHCHHIEEGSVKLRHGCTSLKTVAAHFFDIINCKYPRSWIQIAFKQPGECIDYWIFTMYYLLSQTTVFTLISGLLHFCLVILTLWCISAHVDVTPLWFYPSSLNCQTHETLDYMIIKHKRLFFLFSRPLYLNRMVPLQRCWLVLS